MSFSPLIQLQAADTAEVDAAADGADDAERHDGGQALAAADAPQRARADAALSIQRAARAGIPGGAEKVRPQSVERALDQNISTRDLRLIILLNILFIDIIPFLMN